MIATWPRPVRGGGRSAVRTLRLAASLGVALHCAGCSGLPVLQPSVTIPTEPMSVDAAQARRIISDYRQAHGAGEVVLDPVLAAVAQRQASAMAGADALSHTIAGPLPRRLAALGADRSAAVENVSAGYDTLASAITGWKQSPAHQANLLFGPMRRMGIAAARAPTTRYKTFWSLVMTN